LQWGAALNQGMNYVAIEDIQLVIKVVLSTKSTKRSKDTWFPTDCKRQTASIPNWIFLEHLQTHSKKTMAEFKVHGIVNLIKGEHDNSGNIIKLKTKAQQWLIDYEYVTKTYQL
jgi:hypothetical protein